MNVFKEDFNIELKRKVIFEEYIDGVLSQSILTFEDIINKLFDNAEVDNDDNKNLKKINDNPETYRFETDEEVKIRKEKESNKKNIVKITFEFEDGTVQLLENKDAENIYKKIEKKINKKIGGEKVVQVKRYKFEPVKKNLNIDN